MTSTQLLPTPPLRLAVLGTGPIGRTVGQRWVEAGHIVTFGSRTPSKLDDYLASLGRGATAGSWSEAVAAADVVLLAVNYDGAAGVLAEIATQLAGKTLIDAANPMGLNPRGSITSTLPAGTTRGEHVAALLPQTHVVRAFSHVMEELLENRGRIQPQFWAMAVAGDDPAAVAITCRLVKDTGFTPVVIGDLSSSAPLDPGGSLFPHMFTAADMQAAVPGSRVVADA